MDTYDALERVEEFFNGEDEETAAKLADANRWTLDHKVAGKGWRTLPDQQGRWRGPLPSAGGVLEDRRQPGQRALRHRRRRGRG